MQLKGISKCWLALTVWSVFSFRQPVGSRPETVVGLVASVFSTVTEKVLLSFLALSFQ